MFDPSKFDNDIFDTPTLPPAEEFHFGRASRHLERLRFKPFSFSIPVIGISTMLKRLVASIRGLSFLPAGLRLSISGIGYKVLKRGIEIRRKRGLTILLEDE